MRTRRGLLLLTFAACRPPSPELLSGPRAELDAPRATSERTNEVVELGVNEAHLYPRREDVAIATIAESDSGIILRLASDMPEFSHFLFAPEGEEARIAPDRSVRIDIDRHALDEQAKTVTVWAADGSGHRSAPHVLSIAYFSPDLYAQNGRASKGAIVVDYSDMPRVDGHVSDWIVDKPTEEDVSFARATWGSRVAQEKTPAMKARVLATMVLGSLDPHRGIPSDWMQDAPPFDQYRRVIAGGDHVWCDNFAKIFVRAAVSLGIPARIVEMPGLVADGTGALSVFWADGHTTTEVFDDVENRWIWIDLTFSILGAEVAGLGPLHVAGLHGYLTDPNPRPVLVVDRYDSERDAVITEKLPSEDARRSMMRFFARGQRYQYFTRQ